MSVWRSDMESVLLTLLIELSQESESEYFSEIYLGTLQSMVHWELSQSAVKTRQDKHLQRFGILVRWHSDSSLGSLSSVCSLLHFLWPRLFAGAVRCKWFCNVALWGRLDFGGEKVFPGSANSACFCLLENSLGGHQIPDQYLGFPQEHLVQAGISSVPL